MMQAVTGLSFLGKTVTPHNTAAWSNL